MANQRSGIRIKYYIFALLMAGALIFSGCYAASSENNKLRIALITTYKYSAYWERVRKSAEAKARQLGNIEFEYFAPEGPDIVDEQIQLIKGCVYESYNGIILAAADKDALVEPITKAKDAGIPVVMIDTAVSEPIYDVLLATDNESAGKTSAALMADSIGGKGEIAIVNFSNTALAALRREYGFVSEIAEHWPEIKIVGVEYCNFDLEKAVLQTDDFIRNYPNLKGIWAANGTVIRGVVKSVTALQKENDIAVVGFDNITELRSMLESGAVKAAVAQKPGIMGADSVQAVVDIIAGREPAEKEIDTGVTVITQENMNDQNIQSIMGR